MPAIGGGDDFVWIGGPDEGLWLLVVVGDEAIDRSNVSSLNTAWHSRGTATRW